MLTLQELVNLFLEWSAKVHAKSTTEAYRHQLKKFSDRYGTRPVGELKAIHLQEFPRSWHLYQAVQRLFNWAKEEAEIIDKNPFNKLKRPPIGERRRILQQPVGAVLLRNARRHFRNLLIAYRETFARPQELRLAHWEDIQAVNGERDINTALLEGTACIVLVEHKTRYQQADGNKPRVILLSPRVGRLLVRLKRNQENPRGPIFLTTKGSAWSANAVRCCFRRLRRRIKLKPDRRGENVVAYTYRHTGATAAAAAGIRDRILAEILGHASTRTTARYQHLQVGHLQEVIKHFWKSKSHFQKPR